MLVVLLYDRTNLQCGLSAITVIQDLRLLNCLKSEDLKTDQRR